MAVLVGATGKPPKFYRVPVPAHDGEPSTVLVYRLAPATAPRRSMWRYDYDPDGPVSGRPKWPFARRGRRTGE